MSTDFNTVFMNVRSIIQRLDEARVLKQSDTVGKLALKLAAAFCSGTVAPTQLPDCTAS